MPLPQLDQAPIQHAFRRLDDFICWTRPLFGTSDFDCLETRRPFHSSHRSLRLGAINLSRTDYSTDIRISATVEDLVLFTLNAEGNVRFDVKGMQCSPDPSAGVLVVTPSEGEYIRGKGGGLLLSTRPQQLLETAMAIQGPIAVRLLRERLKQPISFHAYGSGHTPSLPLSLLQSLRLVDSLISPAGTLPTALRLDDLICRQMVLMLCPELLMEGDGPAPQQSAAGFERLLEWICGQLDQPLALSDLERQSGYSRRALQRSFQNRFGCGPMQWVRQRRLEQALQRLTDGEGIRSVSAVAQECGYLSLSSFSRDFRQAYGRRPSEVLRANRP